MGSRRAGNGATCLPVTLKTSPMKPVGVQFAMATWPPARQTQEELARNDVWTRREHGSKHADNEIESAGLIRQRLGVTFLEVDVHPFPIGARAGLVEQVGAMSDSYDFRACSRCRYGKVTRASDIEGPCA